MRKTVSHLYQVFGIEPEDLDDIIVKAINAESKEKTGETLNCCPKCKEDTD